MDVGYEITCHHITSIDGSNPRFVLVGMSKCAQVWSIDRADDGWHSSVTLKDGHDDGHGVSCVCVVDKTTTKYSRVATGSPDKTIRLWMPKIGCGGKCNSYLILKGHGAAVSCIDFCNYNNMIASGSYDMSIKFWKNIFCEGDSLEEDMSSQTLTGHNEKVTSIVWDWCTHKRLFSGSADEYVKVWDVEQGKAIAGCKVGFVNAVDCNDRGILALSNNGRLFLWDSSSDKEMIPSSVFPTKSEASSLKWHRTDPFKLVASCGKVCKAIDIRFSENRISEGSQVELDLGDSTISSLDWWGELIISGGDKCLCVSHPFMFANVGDNDFRMHNMDSMKNVIGGDYPKAVKESASEKLRSL